MYIFHLEHSDCRNWSQFLDIVFLFVCNRGDTFMCQDRLQTRELCQSPMPDHCFNNGIICGASPRCFPYTITWTEESTCNAGHGIGIWSAERHWEADPTTAGRGHFQIHQEPLASRPQSCPRRFYSTRQTSELVQTLGLSDKAPPELPSLKPSSNSVLPVACITRPPKDLRHLDTIEMRHF